MKRLLIAPLLIALAGCSNQITNIDDVGEKITVKDSTVETYPYYVNKLKAEISRYFDEKKETKLLEIDDKIESINDSIKIEDNYIWLKNNTCSRRGCELDDPTYIRGQEALLDNKPELESKKTDFIIEKREVIEQTDNESKDIQTELEKDKGDVHFKEVSFRPIFIDLNKQKTASPRISINCLNPKLDKKAKELWKDYSSINFAINSFQKQLCKRHAKF